MGHLCRRFASAAAAAAVEAAIQAFMSAAEGQLFPTWTVSQPRVDVLALASFIRFPETRVPVSPTRMPFALSFSPSFSCLVSSPAHPLSSSLAPPADSYSQAICPLFSRPAPSTRAADASSREQGVGRD